MNSCVSQVGGLSNSVAYSTTGTQASDPNATSSNGTPKAVSYGDNVVIQDAVIGLYLTPDTASGTTCSGCCFVYDQTGKVSSTDDALIFTIFSPVGSGTTAIGQPVLDGQPVYLVSFNDALSTSEDSSQANTFLDSSCSRSGGEPGNCGWFYLSVEQDALVHPKFYNGSIIGSLQKPKNAEWYLRAPANITPSTAANPSSPGAPIFYGQNIWIGNVAFSQQSASTSENYIRSDSSTDPGDLTNAAYNANPGPTTFNILNPSGQIPYAATINTPCSSNGAYKCAAGDPRCTISGGIPVCASGYNLVPSSSNCTVSCVAASNPATPPPSSINWKLIGIIGGIIAVILIIIIIIVMISKKGKPAATT